jgi:chaperonin cofactor prefoldin
MEEEFVSQEDLSNIKQLRQKIQIIELQKYAVELELKNYILRVYLKHQLSEKDAIQEETGKIVKF